MSFDGAILERGYWIYAILIYHKSGEVKLYIGRTGDNTFKFSAVGFPFQRIGEHLNFRPSAKMNTLKQCFDLKKFSEYQVRLIAVGPLFPVQKDSDSHIHYRNIMTALEKYVADYFVSRGYDVLGQHNDNAAKDPELTKNVVEALESEIDKEIKFLKNSVNPC
jgi:hypothetical protein